jgi:hypothetical protein
MTTWRSDALPWLALGAMLTVTTCSRMANEERRNYYTSREQCLRDYDAAQCRSGGSSSGGVHYGPYYRGARQTADDPGPGRTAAANGQSTAASRVVRGGFGSTARSGHGGYRGG